jgi:hypothetical protein
VVEARPGRVHDVRKIGEPIDEVGRRAAVLGKLLETGRETFGKLLGALRRADRRTHSTWRGDVAHARGYIELDAKAFMHPVRNFHNYIHPRRQAAENFTPDHETVALSWGPVHAVLNDLEQSAAT